MLTSIMRMKFGGGIGVGRLARRRLLFQILQACLVAMVAVGDEDRLGAHHARDRADYGMICHHPHPAYGSQVVGGFQRWKLADGLF